MHHRISWRTSLLVVVVVLSLAFVAETNRVLAGDWPQILGPDRTGIAADEQLTDVWPANGPATVWSRPVGQGTAGVAVADGTVILFHRTGDFEVVEALHAVTGKPRWTKAYPTTFHAQVGGENGPLCVPTIAGDRIVTYGAQGVLSCWSLVDGELQWHRDTHKDFSALEGYFGAGSSPLVDDGRVIVNVGGAKAGAGIVAFDLEDGSDLWTATNERASYAAPTVATVDGRRIILCIAQLHCVGLDPEGGKVLLEIPFGKRGATVNAATPIVFGDRFFLTSSYGVGAVLAQVTSDGASEIWRKGDVMSSQYTTPVAYDGVLFGIDGRQDVPPADLKCIDPQSGKKLWSEDNFGYATLVRAGDKLLIIKSDGELVLARASHERFESLSRHQLTPDTLRALPALANGRLYVRDTETLYCVDVGRP